LSREPPQAGRPHPTKPPRLGLGRRLSLLGAVIEVGGQHHFSSIGQEEGCEPYRLVRGHSQAPEDRWDLYNPSFGVLIESVEDAWVESLEDHAIGPLDLTVSMWMFDRGPVDPDAVSIIEV